MTTTTSNPKLLDKVKKIEVPAPGTGEFVTLPSVEALCTWMTLNNLKAKGWHGNFLEVVPNAPVKLAEPVKLEEQGK